MTYHDWIAFIKQHPDEESHLWFLLVELSGKSRSKILLSPQEELSSTLQQALETGVRRLLEEHYPPQYYVGHTYFYGRKFFVNPAVLIPRYDTEVVVEAAIESLLNHPHPKVLDIGTGSGAIAITIQCEVPNASVRATDICQDALFVAKQNALQHHASIEWIHSDLWETVTGSYDLIISNPPYIDSKENLEAMVNDYEPHLALYSPEGGQYHNHQIIKHAKKYLRDQGILILEIHSEHQEALADFAATYFKEVTFRKDHAGRMRVMIARSPL